MPLDLLLFIFLTLLLSLQASYAAPLILLAQNRQSDRDRVQFQEDRQRHRGGWHDSDYLAGEIAALDWPWAMSPTAGRRPASCATRSTTWSRRWTTTPRLPRGCGEHVVKAERKAERKADGQEPDPAE